MKPSDLFHAVILFVLATAMFVAMAIGARSVASFAQHLKRFTPTPRPVVSAPASIQMVV